MSKLKDIMGTDSHQFHRFLLKVEIFQTELCCELVQRSKAFGNA